MKTQARTSWSLVLTSLLAAFPATTRAAPRTPVPGLHPIVEYSYGRESNLLRVPEGEGTPVVEDHFSRWGAGLAYANRFGNQNVQLRLQWQRTQFDHSSWLDFTGRDVLAHWSGRFGHELSADAGVINVRVLTPLSEYRGDERSLRTLQRTYADVRWRIHPRWTAFAGLSQVALRYNLLSQRGAERDETATQAGADYESRAGSTAGIHIQRIKGEFPMSLWPQAGLPRWYEQDSIEARINWHPVSTIRLHLAAGRAARRHPAAGGARDFNGMVARAAASYRHSDKTSVTANVWRDIGASNDLDAAYAVNRGWIFAPAWAPTGRIKLEALLKAEAQRFVGNRLSAASGERQDRYRHASLTATYGLTDRVNIGLVVSRERRKSTIPSLRFRSGGVTANARYAF